MTETFRKEYPAMYILVKEDVPLGLAMAAVGHAAVAAYIKFVQNDPTPDATEWINGPFRKIVCKVNQKEFDHAKRLSLPYIVMTELSLDKAETALAFMPAKEFPVFFRFLKLYK